MRLHRRRPSIRPLGFLAAAVVVVVASQLAARLQPSAAPSASGLSQPIPPAAISGTGGVVLDDAAPTTAALLKILDARIDLWARKTAADAGDYISASNLAGLRLARAKLTASADDYDAARAAVDRALAADAGYRPARQVDAAIRFTLHDFRGALDVAKDLLRTEPGDLEALATLGDSQLELGHLTDARRTYDQLAAQLSGPPIDLRRARLAWVTGSPAEALRLATDARDGAVAADAPDVALYQIALAETARLAGDAGRAREADDAALAIRSDDTGALLGLARLDAAAGDLDAALERLGRAIAVAPTPEALALQADVALQAGNTATADDAEATIGAIRQLAGPLVAASDRILIRFDLDHGAATAASVTAARASLDSRPDADGHDLLAWALHRTGDDAAALEEVEAAQASGVRSARVLFHAGAIRLATGDLDGGRRALGDALALGAALDPGERAEAARLLGG